MINMKNQKVNTENKTLEQKTLDDVYELHNTIFETLKRISKRIRDNPTADIEYMEYYLKKVEYIHDIMFKQLATIECMYCRTDDLNEFQLETIDHEYDMPRYVCDNCATNEYLYMRYTDDTYDEVYRLQYTDIGICENCQQHGAYTIAENVFQQVPQQDYCLACMNSKPETYQLLSNTSVIDLLCEEHEFVDGIMNLKKERKK